MDVGLLPFALIGFYVHVLYFLSLPLVSLPLPKYRDANTKLPTVSIIIAAFNEEKIIEKTLKGLKHIDYPNYEVIVVCQGTDKTASIAKKYARVVRDNMKGKWHALKVGVKASKGEILYILDADSIPERSALRKLVNSLADHDVATGIVFEEGPTPTAMIFRLQTAFTNYAQYFFLRTLKTGIIQGKNYVIRKKTLITLGGFKKAILEDANITFRLYLARNKVAVVDAKCSELSPLKFAWYVKQQKRWAMGMQVEAKNAVSKAELIDWLTIIPMGLTFGHATSISALFAFVYLITKNVFFIYGTILGYMMYLLASIKFLKIKDVLLSPLSFSALCMFQLCFSLHALMSILNGKKHVGGRTEKA